MSPAHFPGRHSKTPHFVPSWPRFARALLVFVFFGNVVPPLQAAKWREITPEEFALDSPSIDPDFGAEYLFNEATLEQRWEEGRTSGKFRYYNRIKVFNKQGVEDVAKIELVYAKGREIRQVEGRTVKPDGTVINLPKNAIFDQEVVRKGRTNVRATTFAFSNLEPGDIVELQYSKNTGDSAYLVNMDFQSELPARRVYRSLKPFSVPGIQHKIIRMQFPEGKKLNSSRGGAYEFEFNDVPASIEEPYAFPEIHVGPFIVLYYYDFEPNLKTYWKGRSKELNSEARKKLKVSKPLKSFVLEHTADISDPREKLRALYNWCQSEPTNLNYSKGVYTQQEKKDLSENFNPQDTFSRKYGTPENINILFGTMAKALGHEVQLASTGDIRDMMFNEGVKAVFSLYEKSIAIKIQGEWNFFNPGESPFIAFDSIPWWSCGSKALIGDPKVAKFIDVPMPKASYSIFDRQGVFELSEEGTLSGTVTLKLLGFQDLDMKESLSRRFTTEKEENFIVRDLKKNLPKATATNFVILNRSSRNTMEISYDVEIPEYADVTGKRIFLQPAVFQKNATPIFTEEKRQGDILFPYPSTEKDQIYIQVPPGFALEEGSAPSSLDLGSIGLYETKLGLTKSNRVQYNRTLQNNLRMVAKKFYDPIKEIFSSVNQIDQHTLTFKRVEAE